MFEAPSVRRKLPRTWCLLLWPVLIERHLTLQVGVVCIGKASGRQIQCQAVAVIWLRAFAVTGHLGGSILHRTMLVSLHHVVRIHMPQPARELMPSQDVGKSVEVSGPRKSQG
jgi:hypothetical protein